MYEFVLSKAIFTEKQARVYRACLEIGGGKVPEIAREAEIKRSTAYGILDELVKMGVVSVVSKGKQKAYRARDPKSLVDLLDEKKAQISRVLPKLSELFGAHHVKPRIQFFEGRNGVKIIYEDVLGCRSKKVSQIVKAKEHSDLLGEKFVKDYIHRRVAKGITAYDLHPKSGDVYDEERGVENLRLKRHVRYLPPNVFHAAMIMIYDNKVAMVSTQEEGFGFIIESREFSATLQGYFEFMWGLGSKGPEM